MTTTELTATLIYVSPDENSNKFYTVTLGADDQVRTRYGRVGEPGKVGAGGHGRAYFDKVVTQKRRKGYQEAQVTTNTHSTSVAAGKARADLAGESTDPRLTALIDRIVAANAHDIKTASGGRLVVRDGQVSTPLGLLTTSAIDEAGALLNNLAVNPADKDVLARYLTLVPQDVGRSRHWVEQFFTGNRTLQQQQDLLDALRASITAAPVSDAGDDRVFGYSLRVVDDKAVFAGIEKMFNESRNQAHGGVSQLRLLHVYEVTNSEAEKVFDAEAAKVGNVRRMWHGTRAHNVLSILAGGMQVPRHGGSIQVTGRMFGDGIYFSEQSTKSLNYSRGGVWSTGVDARALMFVADVAMGWEYRPNVHGELPHGTAYNPILEGRKKDPKSGRVFDSVNVKAGTGVRNHEAVVPGPSRVALRYLCEFA